MGIIGIQKGFYGDSIWIYWDNGEENGKYYLGFQV